MTQIREMKHSFDLEANGAALTKTSLAEVIKSANGKFPHVQHEALQYAGTLGDTGVVVSNPGGALVASVRAKSWIPVKIDGDVVEFGGPPGEKHVERSFLFESSDAQVQRHAQDLISRLHESSTLGEFSKKNEGAGGGGMSSTQLFRQLFSSVVNGNRNFSCT